MGSWEPDRAWTLDAHFVHLPADASRPSSVWCELPVEGVLLSDRDGAIAGALIEVRRAIAQGQFVRRTAHGQPYWTVAGAADHVRRASARLLALDALFDAQSWADVVREAQEVVELALKGLLRISGVEPPRIHDVAEVLIAEQT
jgi:hypothetical protein